MKQFNSFLLGFFFVALAAFSFTSCDQDIEEVVQTGNSEIEILAKNANVNLLTQTKTISDNLGNSVTFLLASTRNEVLEDFIQNTVLSIEVLEDFSPTDANHTSTLSENDQITAEINFEDLNIEVLSKTFGENISSFRLKVRGQNKVNEVHDRGLLAEYTSSLHIEGFHLNYHSFACGNCNDDIQVYHYTKKCGFCSYKFWASRTLSPGENWSSCNDGRRTRVKIYGEFPISFYDWDFSFWNCG